MAELRLEQKLALKQILTPQLIQSLRLLLIPRLELEQALRQELDENPFLEVKEEEEQRLQELSESESVETTLGDWKKFFEAMKAFPYAREEPDKSELEEEEEHEPVIPSEKNLYDYLKEQVEVNCSSGREKLIGLEIIGNLDQRGFLTLSNEDISKALATSGLEPPVTVEEIEECRRKIMHFDPPGIAARDLRESFLAQLEAQGLEDTLAYEIVKDHFKELTQKNINQLASILGVKDEELLIAIKDLSNLSFSPAFGYNEPSVMVVPDITFEKIDNEWQVVYNKSNIPNLTISKEYLKLLNKHEQLDDKTREFLKNKLESAKAWITGLIQREKTILDTAKQILHHQIDFFENGPAYLRPLRLEDIAKQLGVHISTIHRVVKDKYAQTPYGVFPLKYFFSGGYKRNTGEEVSSRTVKQKIRELIAKEDKNRPLSDDKIAALISRDGIKIARRTVAKYREQMGIPPARLRKGLK